MTRNKEYFADFVTFAQPVNVEVGNGDAVPAYGRSTVNFKVFIKRKWILNRMEDVYYVPKLGFNLFSIGKAAEKGFNFTAFRKNGRVKLSGIRSLNGIYKLHVRVCIPEKPAYVHLNAVDALLQLWHERLCHQNKRHVQQVLNNHGIKVYAQEEFCTGCVYGKHHRESFHSRKYRPRAPGKLIHADLRGPMHVTSLDEMIDHITFQSNLYAHRECNNRAFTVSPQEIRQFIGVILLSGYNCQPEAKHYWSTQPDIRAQGAISCMSHNRFMEIKNYPHLADNQKLVKGDKMSKVTPLYKLLNSSLVKHGMFHEKLSIDESIVLYFGRHAAKMFLKGKPIRFGYKVWMLCGNDGYPYHMTIYQGKEIHAPKVQLSTRVIRSMVDIIQETSNTTRYTLYFDNFFNSYDLLVMLSELKMRAIGTIRPYRSNGADAVMLPDKDLMKQKRGAFDFRSDGNIYIAKWHDNSIVRIASSFMTHSPLRNTQ
ncbi:PiggyBac transposable element-derived protein 2 [Trichinella sp. T8]|nr:PiggyBac transposable element-derived protein 2 [Trichinella sp. T8]